jgi:gas vesicle protein
MERSNATIIGLVFGVVVGGITALFLAPKKEKKSRKVLREQTGWIRDKVRRNKRRSEEELEEALPSRKEEVDGFAEARQGEQIGFVDQPTEAITDAENLVIEVTQVRGYPAMDFSTGEVAMAEHEQQSQLSTADIVQKTEEDGVESPGAMEGRETQQAEAGFAPLLPNHEVDQFWSEWNAIQAKFVDDPQTSVEAADSLVAQVMKRLAEVFSQEREQLESQWRQGEEVSTENLRVALQRYRSFFNRLLSLQ